MDTMSTVKFEAINDAKYMDIKSKGALKKDVIGSMIEMWLVELKRGLLIYENIDTQEYVIFSVYFKDFAVNYAKDKCDKLMKHNITSTLPDKPYDDKNCNECIKCEFSTVCWGK